MKIITFNIRIKQITEEQEEDLRQAAEEMGSLEDNTDRLIELAKKRDVVLKNKSRQEADKCEEVFKRFNLLVEIEPSRLGEEERSEKRSILKPTIVTLGAFLVVFALIGLAIFGFDVQEVSEFLEEWKEIVETGDLEAYEKICSDKFREEFQEEYEESQRMINNYESSVDLEEDTIEKVQLDEKHYIVKNIPVSVFGYSDYFYVAEQIDLFINRSGLFFKKWKIDRVEMQWEYPPEEVEEKTEEPESEETEPKEEVQKEEQKKIGKEEQEDSEESLETTIQLQLKPIEQKEIQLQLKKIGE